MLKNNKGFTLVEVVAAFAVLALISVALLQMFLVSSEANRKAYDLDKANAFSIKVAEQFKVEPEQPQNMDELAGATVSPGGIYIQWYDVNWTTTSAITNARYELDMSVAVPTTVTTMSASYLPDFAWSGAIDASSTGLSGTITIFNPTDASGNKVTTQCSITLSNDSQYPLSSIPFSIESMSRNGVIPIKLQCDLADENTPYTGILIINNDAKIWNSMLGKNIDTIADIYICNNPTGSGLTVNPTLGASNVTYASTRQNITTQYSIGIVVKRLEDNLILRENTVSKYLTKVN